MKKLMAGTITLLAIVACQQAGATQDADTASNGDFKNVAYDRTAAMPDHVAYLNLMQMLARAENENAHAANIQTIEDHLSLDREHAELFLQFILVSYSQMMSIDRAATTRALCHDNKPVYGADQAAQMQGVLHGIRDSNLRRYYRRAHANLGSHVAKQLDTWLSAIKSRHLSVPDNHEVDAQTLGQTCNLIAEY